MIAVVACHLSETPAFAAEDEGGGLVEIHIIEHIVTPIRGAYDLDALILKLAQQHADIFDSEEGHIICASA
jgi:hypothetical protein